MEFTITVKVENDQVEVVKIDKVEPRCESTGDMPSQYARFFHSACPGWEQDSENNLTYLLTWQRYANEKLRRQGYLFLNDVYEMLGMPKTKDGQVVGWIYGENDHGDNFVDFGIYNIYRSKNMDFVNGLENAILLDFNVDGNILDRMGEA